MSFVRVWYSIFLSAVVAALSADPVVDLVRFSQRLEALARDASRPSGCDATLPYIQGAIIASALGDALGRISEFTTQYSNLSKVFKAGKASDIALHTVVDNNLVDSTFLFTDDTVMAIPVLTACYNGRRNNWNDDKIMDGIARGFIDAVVGEQLNNTSGIIIEDISDKYVQYRAHGLTSPVVLRRLRAIQDKSLKSRWWMQGYGTGELQGYKANGVAGCGSVMRVWPIGLIFFDDLDRAKTLAVAQSDITHPLPEAQAACAAMVAGVSYAIRGLSSKDTLEAMIAAAAEYQKKPAYLFPVGPMNANDIKAFQLALIGRRVTVADMLRYVQKLAELDQSVVQPNMILGAESSQTTGYTTTGALLGWTAGEAVAGAAYIFMRNATGNPVGTWKGLQEAVWTVGDSDSIATLAGALLGAYQGFALPLGSGNAYVESLDAKALQKLEEYDVFVSTSKNINTLLCDALNRLRLGS